VCIQIFGHSSRVKEFNSSWAWSVEQKSWVAHSFSSFYTNELNEPELWYVLCWNSMKASIHVFAPEFSLPNQLSYVSSSHSSCFTNAGAAEALSPFVKQNLIFIYFSLTSGDIQSLKTFVADSIFQKFHFFFAVYQILTN